MNVLRLEKLLFAGLLLHFSGAAFADNHEFSIVVLPDTQLYAETYPAVIEAQIQWIIDNQSENIIYVAHLGDLKDDTKCNDKEIAAATGSNRSEWEIINQAFNLLETATSTAQPDGIPFGTVAGNHDFGMQSACTWCDCPEARPGDNTCRWANDYSQTLPMPSPSVSSWIPLQALPPHSSS